MSTAPAPQEGVFDIDDSEEAPCACCGGGPCELIVRQSETLVEPVCSYACGLKILCGSPSQIQDREAS
jgi:hypothetical protein